MTSLERVAMELAAGQTVILQRIPPSADLEEGRKVLEQSLGKPARFVTGLEVKEGIRILDARGWVERRFAGWDEQRALLAAPDSPLVVLLDVLAARSMLLAAPQTCSWYGTIRLGWENHGIGVQRDAMSGGDAGAEGSGLCAGRFATLVRGNADSSAF